MLFAFLDDSIALLSRVLVQLVFFLLLELEATHDLVALVVALICNHDAPVFSRVEVIVRLLLIQLQLFPHQL